jgi:putative transposase
MQAALEAKITGFLGRDRYQRAAACQDARAGSRNGYREVTVKTTAGPVQLARPKLRGTTGAFASRLFGSHVTKTNALESLVTASFVRGLSVRDVEAALAEALGDQARSPSPPSRPSAARSRTSTRPGRECRLDCITLDCLFLGAPALRMHPGSPAEPVLAAWGITTGGKPAFIGLAPAPASPPAPERTSWLTQGPRPALPAAGHLRRAPGLIAAVEQASPKALRQRCLIHYADLGIMPTGWPDLLEAAA